MFVALGYTVVILSIFGGYAMQGGHLGAMWQPLELLMIGGGAVGAFIVGNNIKTVKATMKALPTCFKASNHSKARYMSLMALLYEILTKVRKEGLMAIERDIDNPGESAVFSKYPDIASDHHLIEFITDYLRLMVSGNLNAMEIENLTRRRGSQTMIELRPRNIEWE